MKDFIYGIKRSTPVGIAYLAVSFAFGVMAVKGITPLMATIISLTNLTSSGQFAGVRLIFEAASYLEIAATVFLINLRYSLMSTSLSQKLDETIPSWKKLIFGFAITDELYAIAINEDRRRLSSSYMFGMMILPILGWTLGTLLGGLSSTIFSDRIIEALSLALYSMFIALIIPNAKKSFGVFVVVAISIVISCIFEFVPYLSNVNPGLKIIIPTIIGAVTGAIFFPLKDEKESEDLEHV